MDRDDFKRQQVVHQLAVSVETARDSGDLVGRGRFRDAKQGLADFLAEKRTKVKAIIESAGIKPE